MRGLILVAGLTLREAARRRILLVAGLGAVAFLGLFGVGMAHVVDEMSSHPMTLIERRIGLGLMTVAGLYAAHVLTVLAAVVLPVDTLAGEIQSGAVQTLAVKPLRRADIVMGKWLAHALVLLVYLTVLAGGVLVITRLEASFTPPRLAEGLPLMALEGLLLLSVSIAGGTRFSTIANGMLAFGLVGIAFVGNVVEQIGTRLGNDSARNVGIVASLVMPSEALWQKAASAMQPDFLRELAMTPFSPASVPSTAMVVWAAGYLAVALLVGLASFERRAL